MIGVIKNYKPNLKGRDNYENLPLQTLRGYDNINDGVERF